MALASNNSSAALRIVIEKAMKMCQSEHKWDCPLFSRAGLFERALQNNFRGAYQGVIFATVDGSAENEFIGPFQPIFSKQA